MSPLHLRRWFALSPREMGWVGALLAIFLIGLTARQLHGCRSTPQTTAPANPGPEKNLMEFTP